MARLAQQQGQTPVSKAAILYLAPLPQLAVDTVAVATWLGQVSPAEAAALAAAVAMVGLVALETRLQLRLAKATTVLQQVVLHFLGAVAVGVHLPPLQQLLLTTELPAVPEQHLAFLVLLLPTLVAVEVVLLVVLEVLEEPVAVEKAETHRVGQV